MRLVEQIVTREYFHQIMESMFGTFMPALWEQIMQEEDLPEDVETEFQRFQELFAKEALWLWDGKYQEYIAGLQVVCDEIFTPKEQAIMLDFYTQHPWVIRKSRKLMPGIVEKLGSLAANLGKQAVENVMDVNDFGFTLDDEDWDDE